MSLIKETLSQWQIKVPINGLHDVILKPNDELTIENKVKFHYCGSERVCSVIVDSNREEDVIKEAWYLIDKSLEKICFAYNTEASINEGGYYVIDLSRDNNRERITKSLRIRCSHVKEEP